MRRFVLFVSVVIVMLISATAIGDTEPNDDFDNAEQIVAGVYEGELSSNDNNDYYEVALVAGQLIYVNVTSTPETSVELYNGQQETVESSWMETSHELLWVTSSSAPPSFICYIEVQRSDGEGSYTMEVSIVSQNDANSGGDAGDGFDTATFVADGMIHSGYAAGDDDEDYYAVEIEQKCEVSVSLWNNDYYLAWVFIFDKETHQLGEFRVHEGAQNTATFEVSDNQTVYVKLFLYGTYEFQLTLKPTDPDDGDDGTDGGFDVLSLLMSWLPYIIVLLILVFVVVAIIAVVKRRE
ncbi:MAG: hypothetical protein KAR39_04275 [Thermoplasmata archaeon]|nr:hypothetical protein [Thermoplasmata archaeon]